MAYRPTRLAGPLVVNSSAAHTLYTGSTGGTRVVKEVVLANNSTAGGDLIKIGFGGVSSSQLFVPRTWVAAVSTGASADNLIILALSAVSTVASQTIVAQSASKRVTVTINGEVDT